MYEYIDKDIVISRLLSKEPVKFENYSYSSLVKMLNIIRIWAITHEELILSEKDL